MTITNDILQNYVNSVSSKYTYEETSEMGYRTDFELLLKGIFESIHVSRFDHDARAKQGNKPDFVIHKNDVPILYIETKDIGVSLDKIEKSEQMSRYFGYANLILTDYVEFRFYRNGLPYGEPIKIAEYNTSSRTINALPNNFGYLAKTLVDFTQSHKEPIQSGIHLAKIMGGKARRIRDNIRQFLTTESEKNKGLAKIYETFKKLLVHDLTIDSFSDMYAQTLVYGLFVGRYNDETPNDFSRREAIDLIPASNPLLRHFFDHIAGTDFDKRLEYIVDELCDVFSHADVEKLMGKYLNKNLKDKTHRETDTVIHFYEDFLNEYDPELRKRMGAYYTPLPVVQFIVKSVDQILRKEFGLKQGLADTTKLHDGKHKVQILDPAVGTGTFISAVIGEIYKSFKGQEGRWPAYVLHDLLPRIHGFELMMAPYTIAHLKLGMAFKKTGFKYFNDRRLGIYLTNSLESAPEQESLFSAFGLAESIAEESKAAEVIKKKLPIMVVIGNPPYSGESSNAQYTGNDVYKVEPGGGKLQEKNSKWLNDDYVKFIRLAESMVERTGEGIIAMITPHGYIDNPTFRGMRWHLMKTFDEIYVLDLHGNTNKKEKSPDGTEDKNVFDIKTGVAIFFGVKKKDSKSDLASIYHADLYGKRGIKFKYLNEHLIQSVKWSKISPIAPSYEWVKRNEELRNEYHQGFSIKDLFVLQNTGIVTKRDKLCIQKSNQKMWDTVQDFVNFPESEIRKKYKIPADVRDWKYDWAKNDLIQSGPSNENIIPVSYRPFDTRYTYYTGKARGFVGWPVERITRHYLTNENIGLLTTKANRDGSFRHAFVTKFTSEVIFLSGITASNAINFPLYQINKGEKESNLNNEIANKIEEVVGKTLPIDIFDYVYAVLYSRKYREKYDELLKIDYPWIPYPRNTEQFRQLSKIGQELRQLHLFESPKTDSLITTYLEFGSDLVEKLDYRDGKVFINDSQYFGNVPEVAWNFWIGGYQPAQKWLKDRKGTTLMNSDIEHYQKMVVALVETDKIMKRIGEYI